MGTIYLIAGLGADHRVFKNIGLPGYSIIALKWISPHRTDTLKSYAQNIINQYNILPGSIVIGNSLGGMIAVEMAKIIALNKIILISSIQTVAESPWYSAFFRAFPIYKLIPGKVFTSLGFLIKPMFGKMNKEDAWLFNDMLKKSSPLFVKWAMNAILKWDNKLVLPNLYQITGDKDLIFDYKKMKDAAIIRGGTHIMVFDRATEINMLLKKVLAK